MAKGKEEVIEEPIENTEDGTPAIVLRKVPVYIQEDGDEEPRLISAGDEPQEEQEKQTEE